VRTTPPFIGHSRLAPSSRGDGNTHSQSNPQALAVRADGWIPLAELGKGDAELGLYLRA